MAVRNVILLSVRSGSAERIYSGEQKVELRKTMIHRWTNPVLLYEPGPVCKVTGMMRFSQRRQVRADDSLARSDACLSVEEMAEYSRGKILYAYDIAEARRFDEPRTLDEMGIEGSPSPSYRYVRVPLEVLE